MSDNPGLTFHPPDPVPESGAEGEDFVFQFLQDNETVHPVFP